MTTPTSTFPTNLLAGRAPMLAGTTPVILLQYQDGEVQLWGAGDGSRGQLGPDQDEPLVFRPLRDCRSVSYSSGRDLSYTCRLVAAAWETTYLCPGRSDILISMGSNDFGALGGGENLNAANKARIATKQGAKPPGLLRVGFLHAGTASRRGRAADPAPPEGVTLPPVPLLDGVPRGQGQLGEKTKPSRPILFACCALGNEHTVLLHESNRVSVLGTYVHTREGTQDVLLATGSNTKGQLGRIDASQVSNSNCNGHSPQAHIIKLACGSEHVLVLTSPSRDVGTCTSYSVWGWGWNEHGNLGVGMLEDVPLPARIWPSGGTDPAGNVVDVWAACGTSWLALSSQ
ncbi:hypothetical protein BKA83DRAFT_671950 [Pisolithus microcarpus]|nr:hypothetical protein BKA83DRAFT_671950 [Pisolithus microcarpus]